MLHARSWSSAGLDEWVIPFRKQPCKQATSADCVLEVFCSISIHTSGYARRAFRPEALIEQQIHFIPNETASLAQNVYEKGAKQYTELESLQNIFIG